MIRTASPRLRAVLAVLLLSPSLSTVEAAAQVVNGAAVSGASAVSAVSAAASRAPILLGGAPLLAPSISVNLAPGPTFAPALAPAAFGASPAAASAAIAPVQAAAVRLAAETPVAAAAAPAPRAAVLDAASAVRGGMNAALTGVFHSDSKTAAVAPAAAESRIDVLFDGGTNRRSADAAPVAGALSASPAASVLAKSESAASAKIAAVPPAVSTVRRAASSFTVKALIAAGLFLATPGIALAAAAGAPVITAAASLSILSSILPLASALGAVGGAIFGMFAARPKDGSAASAGETFASILHYGVLGGAGAFVLLNLTQAAFGATAIGLEPITGAIAIAALGRTAFQDKFTLTSTTSADRVIGAFPAVAASVGISVGMAMTALVAPPAALALTLATNAMAATGVATALYAAIFKPGLTPPDGPSKMAKGFVMQSLMMGLALAVTNPYLFWPFAAMGAAGFGMVLWSTLQALWALRPGAPAQPLPPSPPVITSPSTPTTPTTPPTTAPKA
jgi:hypothetical protein